MIVKFYSADNLFNPLNCPDRTYIRQVLDIIATINCYDKEILLYRNNTSCGIEQLHDLDTIVREMQVFYFPSMVVIKIFDL